MGVEVHLLSKKFITEDNIVSSLKRITKEKKLNFSNPEGYYITSVPNYGDQLEFFLNTEKKHKETFDPRYYPEIPNYGALIILGYYNDDNLLVPFLKEFLSDFPEIKVYAGEGLPTGVDYRLYSKIDFDRATTTDIFTFLKTPPIDNDSAIV